MIKILEFYKPIEGKTYSLFGKSSNTIDYYQNIKNVADKILEKYADIKLVLHTVQDFSHKKDF